MNTETIIGSGALWLAIPVAMLAGLVSFLSPCVLPLVPGYLGFLGGAVAPRGVSSDGALRQAQGPRRATAEAPTRGRLVLGVLLFILGFSIVFILYTVLGGTAGVFLLRWGDLITRILGVVIIAMGLVFLGLFGFAQREFRFHVDSKVGIAGCSTAGYRARHRLGSLHGADARRDRRTVVQRRMTPCGRASSDSPTPWASASRSCSWLSASAGRPRRSDSCAGDIRVVNIIGGVLLVVLGILMVTGLWTDIMSRLTAVIGSVILPL